MRYDEFRYELTEEKLEEIKALLNMANWFSQKYHDVISAGSQRLGQGEVQKFTNQHLRAFMQMMGRYSVDWPTVPMYVIYQYLRLIMRLNDQDIADVVNTVAKDPKVRAKKMLTIQQIKDQNKNTLPSGFSTAGGDPSKTNQLIAQMIIAGGAMRQMERHWEKQAQVAPAPAMDHTPPPKKTTPASTATASTNPPIAAVNAALTQLGVTP